MEARLGSAPRVLSNVFNHGIVLHVGGRDLRFRTPAELEFALSGSTSPSAARAAELLGGSLAELARSAERLKAIEARVERAMAGAEAEPLSRFFDELDSWVVDDNGWPDVLWALKRAPADHAAYRLAALAQYRRHLSAAQELIRAVFAERRARREPGARAEPAPARLDPRPRQRLIFELSDLGGSSLPGREELKRLPKGEGVSLRLEPHQALRLILGRHGFVLVAGEPWLLVDPTGADARVRPVKCVVGRDPEAHIAVSSAYRSVSRRHLVIETDEGGALRLTDTSSLGSYAAFD